MELDQPKVEEKVERPYIPEADMNGDGHVSDEEFAMYLDAKQRKIDDEDALRDAQRNMAWFAMFGMLLYPFAVIISSFAGMDNAAKILGDMAGVYFMSVAAIVMGFYGKSALETNSNNKAGK